ncbi:LPS ABC transporter, partial [bacterium (Candidatus Howlettbacteria) CG_4_10_14_0_8_um_filter_40_9]
YATPILYPISFIPDKFIKIVMISPVAQIIQDARSVLLSSNVETSGQILGSYWFIPYALVFMICLSGYFVFNKMSAKFAEEV